MNQLYAGYLIWRSEAKLFGLFGKAVRAKKNFLDFSQWGYILELCDNTGIYFEYSVIVILKQLS